MAARAESTQKRRLKRARFTTFALLAFSVVVFIAIAALAILNEGVSGFFATLGSINFFYYGLALLCVFLGIIIGFPKWDRFVKKLGLKIKTKMNFEIYLSMFSMDITPGRWGRATVAYTLNRITRTRFGETFPAVVADIFTDFLGFIAVALISSFLVGRYAVISIVISILLLIPFFFIYVQRPFEYVKKKLWGFKKLRTIFRTAEIYFKSSRALDLGTYLYAMVFTIPAMILNGLALYFVMLSFGIHLSIGMMPAILFVYTSSFLIGMVTGVPGTLGVTDAALLGYLTTFFGGIGVTFGVASAITIFFRLANIWLVEGIGAVFLAYTLRYWRLK